MTSPIPTYPDLAGKVAVVTGGSRGIGAAICRLLAAGGARVAVNGRDTVAVAGVVAGIRDAGGRAIGVAADVTDFAAVERMRLQVEAEFDPADVLVACAGGSGEPVPTEQMPEEQWRSVLDVNLTATFLTLRSFLPGMTERHRGAIITIASGAGRVPSRSNAAYAAAKGGLVMFTRHVAREVGPHGVRVNCVSPGAILTEHGALHQAPEAVRQQVAAAHPLARLGQPDDVALAVLFLVSDSASWLTGVTLDVTGGGIML